MSGPSRGGIFISYRRQESAGYAGRLYDRLTSLFGEGQVFMDVDTIELGATSPRSSPRQSAPARCC